MFSLRWIVFAHEICGEDYHQYILFKSEYTFPTINACFSDYFNIAAYNIPKGVRHSLRYVYEYEDGLSKIHPDWQATSRQKSLRRMYAVDNSSTVFQWRLFKMCNCGSRNHMQLQQESNNFFNSAFDAIIDFGKSGMADPQTDSSTILHIDAIDN